MSFEEEAIRSVPTNTTRFSSVKAVGSAAAMGAVEVLGGVAARVFRARMAPALQFRLIMPLSLCSTISRNLS